MAVYNYHYKTLSAWINLKYYVLKSSCLRLKMHNLYKSFRFQSIVISIIILTFIKHVQIRYHNWYDESYVEHKAVVTWCPILSYMTEPRDVTPFVRGNKFLGMSL